ncbi:Phytochrome-like protein cph2 [compost metagenome]
MLEHGQSIYANEQPDREHEPVLRTQLNLLGNHSFELELSPSDSLAAYLFTPLPKVVFWAASLISLLLVAALGLAMENARRAKVLSATNLQLNRTARQREEVERRLRDSRESLQLALDLTDSSRDSLFVFDMRTRELLHMNRATHSSLGYDADEFRRLLHDTPERLIPGYFAWLEQVRAAHQQNLSMIFQHEMLRRDGSPQAAEINAQLIRQGGGEYLIAVARDNSERLQLEAQLQILTLQDSLTGLYNRRYFDHKLHSEWRRLRRSEQPLALLMLDVDHFKLFNDCRGHLAGDDALRQIATAMAACMQREGDAACRYGGEEFAIILADTGLEGASHVAERVHEQVAELKISHPECNLGYLTLSIGLAIATPGGNDDPQELIALADGALYAAKRRGGNTTCVWSH